MFAGEAGAVDEFGGGGGGAREYKGVMLWGRGVLLVVEVLKGGGGKTNLVVEAIVAFG